VAQLRGAYDVLEVRAMLLAVNGETDVAGKKVGVGFVGTDLVDVRWLSPEQTDPSADVTIATSRLEDMVALKVWVPWKGRDTQGTDTVTRRLEPVSGATPVP
jgi:hypothetical protein